MFLAAEVAKRENVFYVDTDQVSSSIGKKSCQDDMVWQSFTHGTTLSDGDHAHDLNRTELSRRYADATSLYLARWLEFFQALLHEVFAMYRTLLQTDPRSKLVVVDLDDTLWLAVWRRRKERWAKSLEGYWPIGFMETLLYLPEKRGVHHWR